MVEFENIKAGDEFECKRCNKKFLADSDDVETVKDLIDTFGHHKPDEISVVCDDCYNEVMDDLRKRAERELNN